MLPASIWRPTFDVREPNPYYRWSYSVPVTAPEHDTTVPVYEEHEPAPGSELAGHLTHTHGSSGSGDGSALELASEPGSLASGQHKFAHESADEPAEYGKQLQVPGTQPHETARSLRTATELTRPHLSPSVDDTQQLAMLSRELGLSPKAYEHSLGATLHLAHLSGGRLAMPTSTTHALVSTQALKLALLLYCSLLAPCWLLAGSLLAPCWLLAPCLPHSLSTGYTPLFGLLRSRLAAQTSTRWTNRCQPCSPPAPTSLALSRCSRSTQCCLLEVHRAFLEPGRLAIIPLLSAIITRAALSCPWPSRRSAGRSTLQ